MRVLMIGAGAVGQVYGYHLQQGGAEVTFLIKDKYKADLESGLVLYPLNRRDRTTPVRWRDYGIVTTPAQVETHTFDQVWLSMSSTALRGEWLAPTLAACGDATIVSLLPGMSDRELLLQHVPESRLVNGGITIISYQAPLPDEARFPEPGIAYWLPPLAPTPLDGPRQAVGRAVATLKAGGQPAKHVRGLLRRFPFLVAGASPVYMTLEAAGWSFAEVARGRYLQRCARASREAIGIVAAATGERKPLATYLIRPWLLRLLLLLSPKLIPLDIETYLQYHFTKVGDQTRLHCDELLALGRETKRAAPNLAELRDAIGGR